MGSLARKPLIVGIGGTIRPNSSTEKALKVALEADVLHFHAQTLAAVGAQLGAAAFQSACEEGSMWTLDEAVKKALEDKS